MKTINFLFISIIFLASCTNNASIEQESVTEAGEMQLKSIKKGNIQTFTGKFLCTEPDQTIYANRDVANEWELFIFNWEENNQVSINSYNDYYLTADLANEGEVTATRKEKNEWEVFVIEELQDNYIAIKASNGKYITVDSSTLKLIAKSDVVGDNEKFKLVPTN